MDTVAKVKEILKTRIKDVENLNADEPLSSLGLDSLDLVEISIEIEEAFSIEFTSDEIAGLTTLHSMIDLIEQKIK